MVLKPSRLSIKTGLWFESDVISDGTQTVFGTKISFVLFESDVISDGTQTPLLLLVLMAEV